MEVRLSHPHGGVHSRASLKNSRSFESPTRAEGGARCCARIWPANAVSAVRSLGTDQDAMAGQAGVAEGIGCAASRGNLPGVMDCLWLEP